MFLSVPQCPKTVQHRCFIHEQHSYHYFKRKNWFEAKSSCADMGYTLATFDKQANDGILKSAYKWNIPTVYQLFSNDGSRGCIICSNSKM